MKYELVHGDCIEVLRKMEDNSVDAVVTDPPYGLSFMGKRWDYDVPSVEMWTECLRVLKPGGHLLSFAGSRTYHRMAVNIEDAGFEIRDQIMWVYGSGFPKSHNISKAIDKAAGAERKVIGVSDNVRPNSDRGNGLAHGEYGRVWDETKPTTPKAQQWDGWGSALKPAHEPIVVARKPLIGTIVENVLEHGTGGLNIDGCRVSLDGDKPRVGNKEMSGCEQIAFGKGWQKSGTTPSEGRFPANFIHDGSDEVVSLFPQSNGGAFPKKSNVATGEHYEGGWGNVDNGVRTEMGNGSAARFFYCAKASKEEKNAGLEHLADVERTDYGGFHSEEGLINNGRNPENRLPMKNPHPTVKPVDLMKYLCRLITPPNGVVLDPFMGSGTTGIGATVEGFSFIGIEREEEYINVARHRISHWVEEKEEQVRQQRAQKSLFDW
jgi:DNA modification methylase